MIPESSDKGFGNRSLLDDLIEYVYDGIGCKLILIGDTAQLPPVNLEISPALSESFLSENYSKEIDSQIEINSHYKGYLKKQNADIMAFKKDENLKIPENINYDIFSGLSNEVKSKFKQIRPKTMGQALRIDGITPAAVFILLSHLKRKSIKHIA